MERHRAFLGAEAGQLIKLYALSRFGGAGTSLGAVRVWSGFSILVYGGPMKAKCFFWAVAMTAALAASVAGAQPFPSRPLRIIVPYGPGGSPDTLCRLLGQKIVDSVGQQVIIENRPGASGIIAAELAMKAPPDGYTLFIVDDGHLAINPVLRANLPYVPLRDFAPVTQLVSVPLYFIAPSNSPFRNISEMIEATKRKELLYGSAGNGSPHHLAMELFKTMTGANLVHVPYKGNAQSLPALLAGDVQVLVSGLTSVRAHIDAGRLIALGATTPRRPSVTQNVPSISESVRGFELTDMIGFVVPVGTPRDIVMRLNTELVMGLNAPDVRQRVLSFGMEAVGGTPEQFADAIRDKQRIYGALAKAVKLNVD
jgi:tripartite-type tricarboxylate transporter receptor subunit TctC